MFFSENVKISYKNAKLQFMAQGLLLFTALDEKRIT